MGQKQKTEKKRERKKERKLVITMAKLRMAHVSTHGARKPPGPIFLGGGVQSVLPFPVRNDMICILYHCYIAAW